MKTDKTISKKTTNHSVDRFAGQQFLLAFFSLLKTARIHQDNNNILIKKLATFRVVIKHLFRGKTKVEFLVLEGSFYVDGEKLHYQHRMATQIKDLVVFFEEHWLDGLCFYPEIKTVPNKHILSFIRIVNRSIIKENPNEWLRNELDSPVHQWVEIVDASQNDY